MKPSIPPSFYSDTEVFKQEQVLLLQKLWNFAGFATNLPNHNDYICAEIGGQSLIIQNFHGELRAFRNVCSHRFSQIRQDCQGNGILQCPYHGWVYNSEGIPIGIPNPSSFDNLTQATRESLRLERWLIELCGDFIFVKRHNDGVSLKDFLGSNYDTLKSFSEVFGKLVDYSEVVIDANWKIFLENGLESYHVPIVHGETFGQRGPAEEGFTWDHPHSHYSRKALKPDTKLQKMATNASDNKLKIDRYHHYLIFPALTVSTTYGIWFIISVMRPVSPVKTKAIKYVFACNMGENDNQLDLMSKSYVELAQAVWEEDRGISEKVHLGLLSLDRLLNSIFNQEEERVYKFHQAYLQAMNYSS